MAKPNAPRALQADEEIDAFAQLLANEGVLSYLEIGSKFGGSLWRIARALPEGSRIVSIDLNVNGPSLRECVGQLCSLGYDAKLIMGSSLDKDVIAKAQALSPFDAVFIDGDHKPLAVMADWENYGPLARIVAFHDIGWRRAPEWVGKRIHVPEVWDKIKTGYRYEEIKLCPTRKNNGIGVLWRS